MRKKKQKRIVIKLGTRVITDNLNKIDHKVIRNLSDQIAELMDRDFEIIVVSSGAIAAGLGLLKTERKGKSLSQLQAAASIGQNFLMDVYNKYLGKRGYLAGQILLTQEDFNIRARFLNIRYTLNTLIGYKAVPVINENDSVSTEEIKCGDNDRLSSLVADIAEADMLIILTNVEGLYDKQGRVVRQVKAVTEDIKAFCKEKGCEDSVGGMATKLEAVKNAANAGISSVIAEGKAKNVLLDIVSGQEIGTRFDAQKKNIKAKKRWIAFSSKPKGGIVIDKGAEKALVKDKRSLLPGGIVCVIGNFQKGFVIDIMAENNNVIARGLSNYSSLEIDRIKGKKTSEIEAELGRKDYDEVVHRDNLTLIMDN